MRKITADRIHDGHKWLPENTVISLLEDGTIMDIQTDSLNSKDEIEYFDGIICPGFVNVHCHLELSHFRGTIEEGTSLVPFLQQIMQLKDVSSEKEKQEAIRAALLESENNGIVAVGDIVNGLETLHIRKEANFHIHTFIEALGFFPENAKERFAFSRDVYQKYLENSASKNDYQLRQSIVPHAPYSISIELFSLINEFNVESLFSIHNQESEAEEHFFQNKSGAFLAFYESFPKEISFFKPSGNSSVQTYLPKVNLTHPLILVHNTWMSEEDIIAVKNRNGATYICLCPNANWYIERKYPPIEKFVQHDLRMCIGTDSLASNHHLDVFGELKTIHQQFPEILWEILLKWATWNGAEALQLQELIGELAIGKKPGINFIDNDFQRVKRIY